MASWKMIFTDNNSEYVLSVYYVLDTIVGIGETVHNTKSHLPPGTYILVVVLVREGDR